MIVAILAVGKRGQFGMDDGSLPWGDRFADDRRRFARLTRGHAVIMGRRTWESLPRRPLPGRQNLVVSSTMKDAEVPVFRGLGAAIEACGSRDTYVIGGLGLIREALERHNATLDLTRLPYDGPADTYADVDALLAAGRRSPRQLRSLERGEGEARHGRWF